MRRTHWPQEKKTIDEQIDFSSKNHFVLEKKAPAAYALVPNKKWVKNTQHIENPIECLLERTGGRGLGSNQN